MHSFGNIYKPKKYTNLQSHHTQAISNPKCSILFASFQTHPSQSNDTKLHQNLLKYITIYQNLSKYIKTNQHMSKPIKVYQISNLKMFCMISKEIILQQPRSIKFNLGWYDNRLKKTKKHRVSLQFKQTRKLNFTIQP